MMLIDCGQRGRTLASTVPHRVLVVEDFAPFRRVLCDLLQERPDVVIVGEATNGLDAVRQAAALRPDVVVLDIWLPLLSGVAAADQIRAQIPNARLMFVTNESSTEVVEYAFTQGGHGYVYKPRVRRDIHPVFDAVVRGGRFVGGGSERIARGDSLAAHRHEVLFYSNDDVLIAALSRFVTRGLHDGNVVLVALTDAHARSLRRRLQETEVDLELAIGQQRYVLVNISELLARAMVNGWPDPGRCLDAAADLTAGVRTGPDGQHARIVTCGECSPLIWASGHPEVAIRFEHLWDEIARSHQWDVLCAYPATVRSEHGESVRHLCAEHTAVEIA